MSEKQKPSVIQWLPVVGMAIAAFVFNTTEFAPIALLSDMAADLGVTKAEAGLLITIYAWVVALTSLPLILIFGRYERRRLMLVLLVLFVFSHILSWQSYSYSVLLASRLIIAGVHAIFWSIAPSMAVELAPKGYRSVALGVMATGSSLATVLGLPFGRTVGLYFGWRITFLLIGGIALLLLILLMFILPRMKNQDAGSVKSLPLLFKNKALMGLYFLTAVIVTAHFTGYTYIEPFMLNVAGLEENVATAGLLVFGMAGLIGNYIFARYNDGYSRFLTPTGIIGITLSLLLMYLMSATVTSMFMLCVIWGVFIMIFNLIFQEAIIRLVPTATAIAMGIYSGIYNVGIGSGALVGGRVGEYAGIGNVGFAGFFIGMAAIIFYFLYLRRYFFKKVG